MISENHESILITAGFTAYNAAETIEKALQSALSQTWQPLEIVVIDDASTDNTPDVLENIRTRHEQIRIFRNEKNKGVATSRNRILENAKGKYVAFFDDDDISLPDRIASQFQRISKYEREYANGQPVICHTARIQHFPDGSEIYIRTMGERLNCIAPNGISVARRILMGASLEDGYGSCATCSQMARLSTYRDLGGFDSNLRRAEDTDINIRLARAGGHFVGISRPLVIQTMTKTTEKNLEVEYRNTILLFEKNRDFFRTQNEYDFCMRWLEVKYAYFEKQWLLFLSRIFSVFIKYPLRTLHRIKMSFPNIKLNQSLSYFHTNSEKNHKNG